MTPGKAYLTSEEIRRHSERSDLWGVWLVAHCWGTVAAALTLFALWPNPLTFLLAVMIIGSRQLGFAILMHEAAHMALFKNRRWNEFAGEWLCGWPILADLGEYRKYHLMHHQHTQTDKDPDLNLSKPFPTTRSSLKRKVIRDITGQTGVKLRAAQILAAFRFAGETDDVPQASQTFAQSFQGTVLGRALLANVVVFGVMWMVGDWWWWFAFWALPLLTWYQLVLRIRNIAEHGAVEFSENALRNVRTTYAGPLMRLFLAPYYVNYHLEHHLVMHMPAHNLPKLHKLMLEKGHGREMEIGRTYWDV
ncbi:MAG: fatty acid desaturase family protein [Pseudomonadota bacterium]